MDRLARALIWYNRFMDSLKVTVRETNLGKGVFASTLIRKNEAIAKFDGQIYLDDDPRWNTDLDNHCIQFNREKWRDSDGIARLVNHSCSPNCGIKNLFEIVAMRDIETGEEITWDYAMSEDSEWRMECLCGASSCRKIIGSYQDLPRDIREKYNGYISEWLM